VKGFFSPLPRSVVQTYSLEMQRLIEESLKSQAFDVVVASEGHAPALSSLLASTISGVPKILDALEISLAKDAYQNEPRLVRRLRNGLTWFKLREFSKHTVQKCDACTVPSVQEERILREILPHDFPVEIIPHGLDIDYYESAHTAAQSNSMVFTGSFRYHANLDAVQYFREEIYPEIQLSEAKVRFKVIGISDRMTSKSIVESDSVEFMGLIQDVRPEIAKSWLSVVPLRTGAGTRLKVIESMALGTPVVSTSKGAEGLEVTHNENILIADTPSEFSKAVLSLLRSPELRRKLSRAGHQLVREKYSSEVMGRKFESLLKRVVK
jgi:polysaccharide biosynthesis protein PslH